MRSRSSWRTSIFPLEATVYGPTSQGISFHTFGALQREVSLAMNEFLGQPNRFIRNFTNDVRPWTKIWPITFTIQRRTKLIIFGSIIFH